MDYAEIVYELRRLIDLIEEQDFELAKDLADVMVQHVGARGDCCG
jgi:hypothetical protein